jgi:uncharacterized protein (TIGR00369 family)
MTERRSLESTAADLGEAHLDRLCGLFRRSTIAQSFGMEISFDAERRAVFELAYDGLFDHFLKDVHGGAIATLIDNAGWFTAAARYPTWVVSVEFSVRLHEPAGAQALRAVGSIVRAGRRFTSTEMTVHNADGVLVASGAGTFSVTKSPLPAWRGSR